MAEVRMLEVNAISAHNLKDMKLIGKMHTYVVAWVDPRKKFSSQIDKEGGTSPVWNERLVIPVEQRLLDQSLGVLMLEICTHGSFRTKKVGFVQIPMADVKSLATKGTSEQTVYPVQRPSRNNQGTLTISLSLGERISVPNPPIQSNKAQPAPAFPAYNQRPPFNQPPPYNQPPQYDQAPPYYPPAYGQYPNAGYPPQQPYYSAAAAPPPPGRNRFGGLGGAGAGLAGGLLGGFLLGDLVGSASGWGGGGYDGGYDGGYGGGDYGGYDGGYDGGDYGYDSGGGDFGGGDFGGGNF